MSELLKYSKVRKLTRRHSHRIVKIERRVYRKNVNTIYKLHEIKTIKIQYFHARHTMTHEYKKFVGGK